DTVTNATASGGTRLTAGLLASTSNTLMGSGGNDVFTWEWAAGFSLPSATSLAIQGGANTTRDVVNLRTDDAADGMRTLGLTYADATKTSGDVMVSGLHTAGGSVQIQGAEQLNVAGDSGNDDTVTVTGTASDDILSITPLSGTAANVFLDGSPMLLTQLVPPLNNNPGVAGGSAGPDIALSGLRTQNDGTLTTSGLTLAGGAGNNRLVVQATTESNATVGNLAATAAWGGNAFGSGSAVQPNDSAFDDITVSDNRVRIQRRSAAGLLLQSLVDVNIVTAGFQGPLPGEAELTINSGEEAGVRSSNIADDVTVALSTEFRFQINGGRPQPSSGVLRGDRLKFSSLPGGSLDVFSDTLDPPNISFRSTAGPVQTQPISANSIELMLLSAGSASGVLNILGDNDGANPNQVDEVLLLGADVDSAEVGGDADGRNELYLLLNGSDPIALRNIGFVNVSAAGGADDMTIDPWADNTTGGWGIALQVDGGTGNDHLNYGNVERDLTAQPSVILVDDSPNGSRAGVSERAAVAPTSLAGTGQLQVTNTADGSNVVTADWTALEDLAFFFNDSASGDSDALTLLGTSGNDQVTVNLTRTGFTFAGGVLSNAGAGQEWIDFDSGASQLIQIHGLVRATANPGAPPTLTPATGLQLRTGDGDDAVSITGRSNTSNVLAPVALTVDLGAPSASDVLSVGGTVNADSYFVANGALPGSGTLVVTLDASPATSIQFANTETIDIAGGGGTGADTITLTGDGQSNVFSLTASAGLAAGTARVDAGPTVRFANLGVNGGTNVSDIVLEGAGGADQFAIQYAAAWRIDDVNITGGAPAVHAGDELAVDLAGQGTAALDVSSPRAGTLHLGGAATDIVYADVERLDVQNGQYTIGSLAGTAGNDTFTLVRDGGDLVVRLGVADLLRAA
ncbi:MAG: beta strand repeat-containing protein, partial [Pirellulaceae bacterium]